jgi:DNA polymerase I
VGYGITAEGYRQQLIVNGIDIPVEECEAQIEYWYRTYPGVRKAQARAAAEARQHGYVRDMVGRIRYLPNIDSPLPWLREEAARQAFNHKIQGSAQVVEKRGMARFWRWLREEDMLGSIWPLLQIHDELIVECDEAEVELVKDVLTRCMTAETDWCLVPIEAGFTSGQSWGELE